jgi:hypothetical protein
MQFLTISKVGNLKWNLIRGESDCRGYFKLRPCIKVYPRLILIFRLWALSIFFKANKSSVIEDLIFFKKALSSEFFRVSHINLSELRGIKSNLISICTNSMNTICTVTIFACLILPDFRAVDGADKNKNGQFCLYKFILVSIYIKK